ncbi:MAG TPA: class F sortase [Chloroflexota bacterium]|jgi:sortase (surface protein transpeptidase)|nr:class F sortase [Chloroflexota bacterium]
MAVLLGLALAAPVRAQEEAEPASLGAVPARIDIPTIGTHAEIVPLGLEDDGATMAAPADPDTVGWFELGPGVGGRGNMLLDGHVDWAGRPRVFGRLEALNPGDEIRITATNGVEKAYAVTWVKLYPADIAPLDEIFTTAPDEQITLITCGGAFDQAARMYVSRWVVRAAPLSAN